MHNLWIIVDDGETFEGHIKHWEDTFFSFGDMCLDDIIWNIHDFCNKQKWKCIIREMSQKEVDTFTSLLYSIT